MKILRNKNFSSYKEDRREEAKSIGKKAVGVGSVAAGAKLLDNVHKSGEVSGRVHLYHGTSKDAGKKIREEGLKKIPRPR